PIATPTRYLARVEDQLYLMDGHIEVDGQNLNVTLDWMLTAPGLQGEAVVFRNVFDCAGNVLGLGSGRPVGRMLALEALPAGTQIHDRRSIPLDRPAGDGCYRVEVGLFLADGSRLPLYAPDGSEYPNRLVLLQNR
ncbi:MAG: hypothetical protein NZM11_13590, partial [Anaerolineales bacterium]|nr:hypothetical protein [Anaerolineales bacterium]